jgi:hypothetical protein
MGEQNPPEVSRTDAVPRLQKWGTWQLWWDSWHVSQGRLETALAPMRRSARHPGCSVHAALVTTVTARRWMASVSSMPKRRPRRRPSPTTPDRGGGAQAVDPG